jgi:hypothetical protein
MDLAARETHARAGANSRRAGKGMSPMAKAPLALLATYAANNLRKTPSQAPTSPTGRSGGTVTADNMPGGGRWTTCSRVRLAAFSVADRVPAQPREAV